MSSLASSYYSRSVHRLNLEENFAEFRVAVMSEQLKFIVGELNKEPFNKGLNLIVFDSLSGEQLLQTLSDVLGEVDSRNALDIREEAPEDTVLRLLGMLRVLKYKPPVEIAEGFRQGLLEGHKGVIYPVLEWLLRRVPDLKKRAYLAKYLVKLEVRNDFLADQEVAELYDQYEALIEQFKSIHRESEAVRNSGYGTAELRKDIEEMENEKDIVQKRIERMQRKVDGNPNVEKMLEVAKKLRLEREKEKELQGQKQEQRNAIQHAEQRISRLEHQLRDLRQSSAGATPEGLMQRLEEETNVSKYIVNQKLPKELESTRKAVAGLQQVTGQHALGQDDISSLKGKIRDLNKEINDMSEKRNVTSDPMEDKLTLFRQQAAIVARKKDGTAERMSDARQELQLLEEEAAEKRERVKSFAGETILRGEDFKRYVGQLRGKSNVYKTRRAELSELKAESGVLARTAEVLRARAELVAQSVQQQERDRGVLGYKQTQDELERVAAEKAEVDEQKGRTLEDMSGLVTQLTMKISERKARLAPIIKELRPLRQQSADMQLEYDEKKQQYDTLLLQLESGMSRLEQEVKKQQEEILQNETKYHTMEMQMSVQELWLERAQTELKTYVASSTKSTTGDGDQEKKRSVREQLLKIISEREKRSKVLKEEQKRVKDNLATSSKQVKLWSDLERLFDCKRKCLEMAAQEAEEENLIHREQGAETLVL